MFKERYAEIAKKTLKNCKARIETPDASAYLITFYNRETRAVALEVLHRRPGGAVFTVLKTKTLSSDGIRELLAGADSFIKDELDPRLTLPSEDMIDFADLSAGDLQSMEAILKPSKGQKQNAEPVTAKAAPRQNQSKTSPVTPDASKHKEPAPARAADVPPVASPEKKADKSKPFGVSISALSRWLGAHGFSTEQIFQAYSDLGIATVINRNAVISYARLGRNNDVSRGALPELSSDAVKTLSAYKKSEAAAA